MLNFFFACIHELIDALTKTKHYLMILCNEIAHIKKIVTVIMIVKTL